MTTFNDIRNDQKRSKLERKVAGMMYEGFGWGYIAKTLGWKAMSICPEIARQVTENEVYGQEEKK